MEDSDTQTVNSDSDNEGGNERTELESIAIEDLQKKLDATSGGLTSDEAQKRLEKYGPNQLEEQKTSTLQKFLSYFWGPIPWMIEVAAILSAILKHWPDLIIIFILLLFNALVGFLQENQAANAIDELKKQLALKARALRDGEWDQIEAADLVPGDIIRLRLGDVVPADVKLVDGDYISVDQSALTGESLPVNKKEGGVAYSGSVVKQGEMLAMVSMTGTDTFFGKTAQLVSGKQQPSHFQKAVLNIGDYLIQISLVLVVILIIVQLFRGASFLHLMQFALILTVASIPVAMPAVLSVTMAVGAKSLSKMKAIVSRLESVEEMAGMDILCSDKTGTLTQNKLTIDEPAFFATSDKNEIILAGALASKAENQDVIDNAVIKGLDDQSLLKKYNQKKFIPFDPVRKRTEAEITGPDSESFKVSKGAPQVILDLCHPDKQMREEVNKKVNMFAHKGYRTLGVARCNDGGKWQFLGLLPMFDPPREDSADTIERAEDHGIDVKMITGDNLAIAKETSQQLHLGTNIEVSEHIFDGDGKRKSNEIEIEKLDGFAQVFPEHKYNIVKTFQNEGHIVGMTGDGVNDAPALKQADVGIAVSGATDAARSAADLVLTAPGLSVIIKAVEEARRIFERMNSYAIYRIVETIRIMFFMVLAMIAFNFYPITAIMIILLALLNDLPIMAIANDRTWLDPNPVRWDMRRVLTVSTVLGAIGVIETFGLLFIVKEVFHLSDPLIQSLIFYKLVVAGHLTLIVARTKKPFYTKPYPSKLLSVAIISTPVIAALLVGMGIFVTAIPWSYIGYVTLYCIVWLFIEDWAKLWVYRHITLTHKHHLRFLGMVSQTFHSHTR
ncbi:MAG TPA: plasma-membrane proton-efflux P-type ATPase [Balneolales bacterium]|nr:plasma-membrane proton-efflux P-type ATPase [Balneolales bacterium]